MSKAFVQVGIQNALTVSSTAVSLTLPSTTGINPTHAIIQVNDANVRWRADGTAPTTTAGLVVAAGSNIEFMDADGDFFGVLNKIQFIRDDATDAVLEVAFFAAS